MEEKYTALKREIDDINGQLTDQSLSQPARAALLKRYSQLTPLAALYERQAQLSTEAAEYEQAAASGTDDELATLAKDELPALREKLAAVEQEITEANKPTDPDEDKPAIIEIRAGAGGDEASLFAGELYGMYQRYAESHGWPVEMLSHSPSEAGGMKEVIVRVGEPAYGSLRYEAGTHRVQRIPTTESGGRIHTSTVTVAVLPEAEAVEVEIKPEEIRTDVFRSSGPGGQSVNTTDSAVRITHVPTGLVVTCQDEKSQHKNKAKAMTILRTRLKQLREDEAAKERGDARRSQVGTGERSEKIRTYNFPQDRVTDHRIGFSTHGLTKVLEGGLDPIIAKLREAAEAA